MSYTADSKPTDSFTNDSKPSDTFSNDDKGGITTSGVPIGLLLALTHTAFSINSYTNDSKP